MQEMTAHVTLKIPTGDSTKTLFTDFVLGADCSITQCDGPFVRTHMLNDFNRFMEEHNLWDKQDIEVWSFILQDIAPHDLQKWLCKPQSLTPKGKYVLYMNIDRVQIGKPYVYFQLNTFNCDKAIHFLKPVANMVWRHNLNKDKFCIDRGDSRSTGDSLPEEDNNE